MQNPSGPEGALPHQESKRIIQDLFPEEISSNAEKLKESREGAVMDNSHASTFIAHLYDNNTLDGTEEKPSAERMSSDSFQTQRRRIVPPEKTYSRYYRRSATIRDEDSEDLEYLNGAPLGRVSSSTMRNGGIQGPDFRKDDPAGRGSTDVLGDVEKADSQPQWKDNVVGWDGPSDPQNPQNWTKSKKYLVTVFYASMTFCITFASTIFSTATEVTAKKFGVSNEVMTLGTSLFVLVSAHRRLRLPQH